MASCDKLTKQQGTEQAIELLRQVKKDAKKRPNASATNATNRLCVLTLKYQRILMPRTDLCARALASARSRTDLCASPTDLCARARLPIRNVTSKPPVD